MTPPWTIERLQPTHERSLFDCGSEQLNAKLHQQLSDLETHGLAKTYVAISPGEVNVLGYYTFWPQRLCCDEGEHPQPAGPANRDIPVILLGGLAVDRAVQGHGLGEQLLLHALRRVNHLAKPLGIRAVLARAETVATRQFYREFGFHPLADNPIHFFLPMQVIRQLKLPRL